MVPIDFPHRNSFFPDSFFQELLLVLYNYSNEGRKTRNEGRNEERSEEENEKMKQRKEREVRSKEER